MALTIKHKDSEFGIGDKIRVIQKIKEGDKERTQSFEGMLISIRGLGMGQTFTVRRIGVHLIGIERIFPLFSPTIERVEILKKGTKGVRSAKLFYTRGKSKKEIEKIFARAQRREKISTEPESVVKKGTRKKISKKASNVKSTKK